MTSTERDLFDELQGGDGKLLDADWAQDWSNCDWWKDILALDKRIGDIDVEIEKLYEKHNVSKEKADFIEECDSIASVLNQFIVRLQEQGSFAQEKIVSRCIGCCPAAADSLATSPSTTRPMR